MIAPATVFSLNIFNIPLSFTDQRISLPSITTGVPHLFRGWTEGSSALAVALSRTKRAGGIPVAFCRTRLTCQSPIHQAPDYLCEAHRFGVESPLWYFCALAESLKRTASSKSTPSTDASLSRNTI